MIPEEDPAAVEARVRELIEAAVRGRDGIRVEIRRLLLARALRPLPGHEQLVAALRRHGQRVFGVDLPATGVPLYADARLYGEHGVPTVMYGAGPRTIAESNAKRPDENLLLEDLRRATHVVAGAVHDLLTGGGAEDPSSRSGEQRVEPQARDPRDLAQAFGEFCGAVLFHPAHELVDDAGAVVALHRDDERESELRVVARVERLQLRELLGRARAEAGARLLARRLGGELAAHRGLPSELGVRAQQRELRSSPPLATTASIAWCSAGSSRTAATRRRPRRPTASARRCPRARHERRAVGAIERVERHGPPAARTDARRSSAARCRSGGDPDVLVALRVVEEARERREACRPADEPAVQPDRQHLRRVAASPSAYSMSKASLR